MVIVVGAFEVDARQRERFLSGRLDMIRTSRDESGCLDYTYSADPIDPTRVLLFERWESQEALDAHLAELRVNPRLTDLVAPLSSTIMIYDVSGERPLEH